jgi:hypothetical protein
MQNNSWELDALMISSDVCISSRRSTCSSRLHLHFPYRGHVLWFLIAFTMLGFIAVLRIKWYLVQHFAVEKRKETKSLAAAQNTDQGC